MRGKFDYKRLSDFRTRLESLNEEQNLEFLELATKELAARLLAKVKRLTPVDTGHLRRNWAATEGPQPPGRFEITIINPVEYAIYVEYGHATPGYTGWVDGRYMLTISLEELRHDAARILQNRLKKYIEATLG